MTLPPDCSKVHACKGRIIGVINLFHVKWLIAKVVPVFKKEDSKDISNYRPVANLCSASKIFENLTLLRIRKLEILMLRKVKFKQN